MALVLVEGENKIPSILGASDFTFTSTSNGPQSNSVGTSNASGRTIEHVSRSGRVIRIAILVAALFLANEGAI